MKYYEIKTDGSISATANGLNFAGKIGDQRFSPDIVAKFQADIDSMVAGGCIAMHIERRGVNDVVHRTMADGSVSVDAVQSDAYDYIDNWISLVSHEERDATPEEIAAMTLSPEQEARFLRNQLLAETDFWALSDHMMTEAQAAYRQALRDVPSQSGFPDAIVWPTKP